MQSRAPFRGVENVIRILRIEKKIETWERKKTKHQQIQILSWEISKEICICLKSGTKGHIAKSCKITHQLEKTIMYMMSDMKNNLHRNNCTLILSYRISYYLY